MTVAIRHEHTFVVQDLLDGRAAITDQMVEALFAANQHKQLVQLIAIPKARQLVAIRPRFIPLNSVKYRENLFNRLGASGRDFFKKRKPQLRDKSEGLEILKNENEIRFIDIVSCGLAHGEKTRSIIELVKLMRNEI